MSNANEQVNALSGEREIPNINENKPNAVKRGVVLIMMFLIIVIAVLVGVLKYKAYEAAKEETAAKADSRLKSVVPARTFTEPTAPKVFEEEKPEANQQSQPATPVQVQPATIVQEAPKVDKSSSSLMVVEENAPKAAGTQQGREAEGGSEGSLGELLTGTRTLKREASFIGDRNYILAKGRFINCALNTRLDSTVPGMTSCVVTRNIYSDNGKVLLVERGSEISGEYKSNMKQGMARIFVLWTRIKTPNGVIVSLDSPGADPLGGSGLPGYVDNHFWDRFGGALMLSLVDDVAQYATNKADDSNQTITFDNTQEASQDMAAEALKNTINIPPTLYKNQGDEIGIYVARDLDFSEVYYVGPGNIE